MTNLKRTRYAFWILIPISYILMHYVALNCNLSTILFFALALVLGFASGYIARLEDESL